jgi:hypothetical protein
MSRLSAYYSASVSQLKTLGAESHSEVSTAAAQTVGELSVASETAEPVANSRLTSIAVATFGSGQKDLPKKIGK